jgi:NTP pyrophosphatase (non-canonical NTP hydrolase)
MLSTKLNNHIEQRAKDESAHRFIINKKVDEALVILSEECAEVVQEVCKIQRFGMNTLSHHTGVSHQSTLEKEVADILAMVDILIDQGILSQAKLDLGKQAKVSKLKKWSKLYE